MTRLRISKSLFALLAKAFAGAAENCSIAGVESLGDDLWRVDLKDRQWGKPQTVTLAIGKPVAQAAP